MKKILLFMIFIFAGFSNIFAEGVKVKADAKIGYPIYFGEKQLNYFSICPAFDLKVEVPVYNGLGAVASGEFLFGNFSDKLIGGTKVGKYQFYTFLAGAFYSINLNNGFSIIPSIQAGFSQFVGKLNDNSFPSYDNYFALLASVELEKQINEHFALDAVAAFGYYDVYCPLSLGIGAAYIF